MAHPKHQKSVRRRARLVEPLETRTLLAATVIDAMVLYDLDAKAQYGNSDAAIQTAIRQSVDFANLAHQNTGDNVVLRLVHTGLLSYTNPGVAQATQLDDLEASATAASLRNQYGADLVAMVIHSAEGGGLGNVLLNTIGSPDQAFSVVDYRSIGPGSNVLAHEWGHNMGARHERDNVTPPGAGATPYAYGYHTGFTGPSAHGTDYGDVMSYKGAGLPVFSNPDYIHDGVPLGRPVGDPNSADLRSTFLVTGPKVAAYRATVVANAAPTATLWQADLAGDQLTFRVRYVDDAALSAATFGDGDASVRTPEGFDLKAAYVGADVAGDGYARVATYRVTLPASNPPVTSLQFHLNAAQVTDTAGAAVAGGQLAADVNGDLEFGFGAFQLARDTGVLPAGTQRRLTGVVGAGRDTQDLHRFTVDANVNVTVTLTGLASTLAGPVTLFVYRDGNLNEARDNGETLGNSQETGTADRTFSFAATPGTYYLYLQQAAGDPLTNYALTVRAAGPSTDAVPPTAPVLDKADQAHAGSTTVVDFYIVFSDDFGIDPVSVKQRGYLAFFTPAGNGIIKTPADVTVSGRSVIAHYTHTFGTAFNSGTVSIRLNNSTNFETQVRDLAGNLLPVPAGTPPIFATYRVGTLPADTTAPTATLSTAPAVPIPTGTSYDFVVGYRDNRGVTAGTIGSGDVLVTGPGGFSQTASLVPGSVTLSPGAGFTYATYRITPPGGAWDWTDFGTYTVAAQASQVQDATGLSVPAGAIGNFAVSVPYPADATGDGKVDFEDLVRLAQGYNTNGRGYATGDFNFDGAADFADLVLLAQNYNTARPAAPTPAAAGANFAAATPAANLSVLAAVDPDYLAKLSPTPTETLFSRSPIRPAARPAPAAAAKPARA